MYQKLSEENLNKCENNVTQKVIYLNQFHRITQVQLVLMHIV